MTVEEHKKILDSILTSCGEEQKATVSAHLLALETDYKEQLAQQTVSAGRIEALEKQNKDYAEVNTRLFLERRNPINDTNSGGSDMPDVQEQEDVPPKKLSYDDLVL